MKIFEKENLPGQDSTLKTTALLYLKDALLTEAFESCKELIDSAKTFGAQQNEISQVLSDYLEGLKAANKANQNKNRLNIFTEAQS